MLAGQGIFFSILGSRTICKSEVESCEEESPLGLSGIQSLGRKQVFQILVVC